MNLKNKTDKELWKIFNINKYDILLLEESNYDIKEEIIRREKERIKPYKDYVCDKLRREEKYK